MRFRQTRAYFTARRRSPSRVRSISFGAIPDVSFHFALYDAFELSTHTLPTLLTRFFPCGSDFEHGDVHSVEDWISVLRLSTRWGFESIRRLAIHRLGLIACPIDKIIEGKACGVEEWLVQSFADVCNRAECLTTEEGRRLGVDDAVFIMRMRESVREVGGISLRSNTFQDTFAHSVRDLVLPTPFHPVIPPSVLPHQVQKDWRDICGVCGNENECAESSREGQSGVLKGERYKISTVPKETEGLFFSCETEEHVRPVKKSRRSKSRNVGGGMLSGVDCDIPRSDGAFKCRVTDAEMGSFLRTHSSTDNVLPVEPIGDTSNINSVLQLRNSLTPTLHVVTAA